MCTISGTPGTRPAQLDGATLPATGTHHAAYSSSPPDSPPPPPPRGLVGGWADRKLPESERQTIV